MSSDLKQVKIFISYSSKDAAFLKDIKTYVLSFSANQNTIVWDAEDIRPGQEWDDEIKRRLNTADIVLLLISPDFLLSEYINKIEITTAFDRYERKECSIIPIYIRYCELDDYPRLNEIQGFPKGKVFAELKEEKDRFYAQLSRQIKTIINEIRTKAGVATAAAKNIEAAEIITQYENETAKITLVHSRSSFGNTVKVLFLNEVEKARKYQDWKFPVQEFNYDNVIEDQNSKIEYIVYIITAPEDIESVKSHLAAAADPIGYSNGQYKRNVLWVSESALEAQLPVALKSNKIVEGPIPSAIMDIIKLLEKERLALLQDKKNKYSQQHNVYLLYDFDKDHENPVRICLKKELEDRPELLPFYSPPNFSALEIQQELKNNEGAILFYGTTATNWYCFWQSEIQKMRSLSEKAVCLSDPQKLIKIERDVSKKAFVVWEDDQRLREYVNQFVENLKNARLRYETQ